MPRVCSYGWKWVKKKLPWPSSLPIFFPFSFLHYSVLSPFPYFHFVSFPYCGGPLPHPTSESGECSELLYWVRAGIAAFWLSGQFAPRSESESFNRTLATFLPGVFVPWNLWSREFSLPGTFLPGRFVLRNFRECSELLYWVRAGIAAFLLSGQFAPRSKSESFNRTLATFLHGVFVPWNLWSREFSLPGTFLPGPFVPRNFRSRERMF